MKAKPIQSRFRARHGCRAAFTLIELILVMTLLVIVLTAAYGMVVDCMDAERRLDTFTLPEKTGEGILAIFRRDLASTFFRHMGRSVFLVADGGSPPDSRDELRFICTVKPTPIEDDTDPNTVGAIAFHTLTGVQYRLEPSQLPEGVEAYTLYRKEMIELDPEAPLESPGINYEIYDKVRYLNIECFDGWSWYTEWDSEVRIEAEEEDLLARDETRDGITRVSDTGASSATVASAPGVNPDLGETLGPLPPSAVPVAIRIEIGVYVASGGKLIRDPEGLPLLKTYATTVQILSAQRIPIELMEEDELAGADGLAGEDGGGRSTGGISGTPLGGHAGARGDLEGGGRRFGGRGGAARGARGSFPGGGRGAQGRGGLGPGGLPAGRGSFPGGSRAGSLGTGGFTGGSSKR